MTQSFNGQRYIVSLKASWQRNISYCHKISHHDNDVDDIEFYILLYYNSVGTN